MPAGALPSLRGLLLAVALAVGFSCPASLAAVADPAPVASPDVASTAPVGPVCPGIVRLESRNSSDYEFVLGAAQPVTVSLHIELYTLTQEYVLELPAVDVKSASTLRGYADRSAALDLHNPGDDAFVGASVEAQPAGAAKPCDDVVVPIPSVADVLSRPASAESVSPEEAAIAAEFAANRSIAAPMLRVLTKSYSCGVPFASARVERAVTPRYPNGVYATGLSLIRVDLDEHDHIVRTSVYKSSGYSALDDEALSAAAASTYRSQVVACRGVKGTYLFAAQFQRSN